MLGVFDLLLLYVGNCLVGNWSDVVGIEFMLGNVMLCFYVNGLIVLMGVDCCVMFDGVLVYVWCVIFV